MENKSMRFSRFRGPPGARLTKRFRHDENGEIVKDSQPYFATGRAETIEINNLSDIQGVIESLGSNECISTGIFDLPSCEIVTSEKLDDKRLSTGIRSRSKKHMNQPSPGLVLLDHDISSDMPDHLRCDSPNELIKRVTQAIPTLRFVAYSGTDSCSSGIFSTTNNNPYLGNGGLHVYIAVKEVVLLELQRYMEVKLWNAGFGFIAFAKNGAMLNRCIIDLSVLSQERLIYEAAPILGEGLSRKPRRWEHHGGCAFSRDLGLTQAEIAEYDQRVGRARDSPENKAKSRQLQAIYHKGKVKILANHKAISLEEAERLIPRQSAADLESTEHSLRPNDIVEIRGLNLTTSELLDRGSEFDNTAMPDPIEGSGYGQGTAKFYYNDGNSPCIRSHAHGRMTIYTFDSLSGFLPCKYEVIQPDQPSTTVVPPLNPLVGYSLKGQHGQLAQELSEQVLILGSIALQYQSTVIYAAPNTGKTLIILWLLIQGIKNGIINPANVFYVNVDDTPTGLIQKLKLADKHQFHILAEGYNDFKAEQLMVILERLIANDQAKGIIVILDTLKKFTDLMDKRKSSGFGKTIRRFIMKGGTCISLAHTNKHRNSDGKPVYAGTTDIIDDADCAYILYEVSSDDSSKIKTVQFENQKSRGSVSRSVSYRYSIADSTSYEELFESVQPVTDTELSNLKQVEKEKADAQIIKAIVTSIQSGITTKMTLIEASATETSISRRKVLNVLEKYTGTDIKRHRWSFTVGERGAKTYFLLDQAKSN